MKKRWAAILVCAVLCVCFSLSSGEGMDAAGERTVMTVNDTAFSYAQIRDRLKLELFLAALNCAGYGYGIDVTDPLTIEDKADKMLFDLQDGVIQRMLEKERHIALEAEDIEAAKESAEAEWERYRAIAFSDSGMAFLPAGDYEPARDPEENITRYFASFGLTGLFLFERALQDRLDDKLYEDYTADLEGTEDEKLEACAVWQLSFLDEAEIWEDGEAIAHLLATLWE